MYESTDWMVVMTKNEKEKRYGELEKEQKHCVELAVALHVLSIFLFFTVNLSFFLSAFFPDILCSLPKELFLTHVFILLFYGGERKYQKKKKEKVVEEGERKNKRPGELFAYFTIMFFMFIVVRWGVMAIFYKEACPVPKFMGFNTLVVVFVLIVTRINTKKSIEEMKKLIPLR